MIDELPLVSQLVLRLLLDPLTDYRKCLVSVDILDVAALDFKAEVLSVFLSRCRKARPSRQTESASSSEHVCWRGHLWIISGWSVGSASQTTQASCCNLYRRR